MKTIDSLKKTLAVHASEFARGRAHQAALATLDGPEAVLGSLAFTATTTPAERDAITLALIAEHQRAAHPLWQSVLLVAYEPMLAGVWKRLHDRRDAEARLVLALLEAIAKVSLAHPPQLLALHLRRAVERTVFGSMAESHVEPELVPITLARKERSHESPHAVVERVDEERRLKTELEALFGDEAPVVLDVLLHARTGREQLAELVDDRYPRATSKERATIHARLQRLRREALDRLQTRFGPESEHAACSAA